MAGYKLRGTEARGIDGLTVGFVERIAEIGATAESGNDVKAGRLPLGKPRLKL